tara:strand:+ start:1269 stop:1811 length:543 start_codon:yes stop_codon:yes gene_type:complete
MSSATANSAARKRRAGKQNEPVKSNVQKQNNSLYRDAYDSTDFYDIESTMKPILNSKDAIYLINNRLLTVERILHNMGNIKQNEIKNLNDVLEKVIKMEKKIDDTVISCNVKNNMLEGEVIGIKEQLTKLIENNSNYSKIFDKMQSLVIYNNENENNENNENNEEMNELPVEELNVENYS